MLKNHSAINRIGYLLLITILSVALASTFAVSYGAEEAAWSKRAGGIYFDKAYSTVQSSDGGFVVAGFISTRADDSNLPGTHQSEYDRLHVAKIDADGNLLWNKNYTADNDNRAYSIIQTKDGGYAIAGERRVPILYKYGPGGDYDFWLIKTDSFGNLQWNKTYGERELNEGARSVIQTSDGGYVLAGPASTYVFSSGSSIMKVDANGNLEWSKRFPDEGLDIYSIVQTDDNGYAISGELTRTSPTSYYQGYLARTDALGNKLWHKTYTGTWVYSMTKTSDQGFALAGKQGVYMMLLKVDSSGNIQWTRDREFGYSVARSVVLTDDGGYAVAGETSVLGSGDFYLAKTDASGNLQWNRTYGEGSGNTEIAYSVVQTSDGGYFLAGATDSPIESYESHFEDWLLIKTDSSGVAPEISETLQIPEFPSMLIPISAIATTLISVIAYRKRLQNMRSKA